MLPAILLIAQFTTAKPLPPVLSISTDSRPGMHGQPPWQRHLTDQQQQVNLQQQHYQTEQRKIEQNVPPSRIDCYPLFPPVSGYPPGISPVSCSRL